MSVLVLIPVLLAVVCSGKHVKGPDVAKTRDTRHLHYKYLLACGTPPRFVDKRKFRCTDGVTVPRQVTTTTAMTTTTTTLSPKTTEIPNIGSCRSDDELICYGVPHCGARQGYRCCGFDTYDPATQTCCLVSSVKYKVHDGRPQLKNICCELDVFSRRADSIPCEHPSSNDKFFKRKLPKLKKKALHCNKNNYQKMYIFQIDVKEQQLDGDSRYLKGDVTLIFETPAKTSTTRPTYPSDPARPAPSTFQSSTTVVTRYMIIHIDKYSTWKRNLIGKSFISISSKHYLKKADFFLSRKDELYRFNKRGSRRLKRWLRKLRKCQYLKNN